eukprot:1467934-Pyramimonas_sp.AAC.1
MLCSLEPSLIVSTASGIVYLPVGCSDDGDRATDRQELPIPRSTVANGETCGHGVHRLRAVSHAPECSLQPARRFLDNAPSVLVQARLDYLRRLRLR